MIRQVTERTALDGSTYYSAGGTARFRSKEVAQQVADNHARFQAATNREGMTAEEKTAAFRAFFGIKGV